MQSKTEFKKPYESRKRHTISAGKRMQNNYGYEINKYGQKTLVKTGETDLYAIIQESLEETKIENILKRVAMGDTTVMRPDGIYADVSEVPTNLIEARQQMQKLENLWNGLDIDTKRKYNFDVEQFIASAGKEDWLRDMGLLKEIKETQPEIKPAEEKADE